MTFMNYDLEALVKEQHELWFIEETVNMGSLVYRLKKVETKMGRTGYGLEVGLRCLFLQFQYDLSDRQLEERIKFDLAFKWYCRFSVGEKTPDHSFFGRVRKAIGTKGISKIFKAINNKAEDKNIIRNTFYFVDSSSIKAKETTWKERDKAIAEGEEKLNNDNIDKYSADKDARFGCKGKDKFWYGYKGHACVDMGSMLITKVAATPANIPDEQGFKHVCPYQGMVFADKAYCLSPAQIEMAIRGVHSGAILKNNMIGKNRDKDRWISKVRAPFECVFSKIEKRTRYKSNAKVQLQLFMDAIVWNVNRLVKIGAPPLFCEA